VKLILSNLALTKEQILRNLNQAKEAYKKAKAEWEKYHNKISELEKQKAQIDKKFAKNKDKYDWDLKAQSDKLLQEIGRLGNIANEYYWEMQNFEKNIAKYEKMYKRAK
jgi:uncharacterized coiled-coil DUF342 family protein